MEEIQNNEMEDSQRFQWKNGGKMKALLKKNQIIITALMIMIAIAGYLNFTKDDTAEQASNLADQVNQALDYEQYSEKDGAMNEFADISDEDITGLLIGADGTLQADTLLANGGETADANMLESEQTAGTNAELQASADEPASNPGEAVLVSTTIQSGFFSNAKLVREQTRSKNKESLMAIVADVSLSTEQKQAAVDSLVYMAEIAEKEGATELLLEAKGFDGVVVSIMDTTVDVVINAEAVTEQQIAQIEDIVIRKTGMDADCITISAVVTEE